MNRCAAPRSGIDPATGRPYEDRAGSAAHEKFALRSYSHQAYLWAGQLSDQDPTTSLNPQEYFDLLKILRPISFLRIFAEELPRICPWQTLKLRD